MNLKMTVLATYRVLARKQREVTITDIYNVLNVKYGIRRSEVKRALEELLAEYYNDRG